MLCLPGQRRSAPRPAALRRKRDQRASPRWAQCRYRSRSISWARANCSDGINGIGYHRLFRWLAVIQSDSWQRARLLLRSPVFPSLPILQSEGGVLISFGGFFQENTASIRNFSLHTLPDALCFFVYSYILYYVEYYPCGGAVGMGSRAISPFGRRPTVGACQSGGSTNIVPRGGSPARPGSSAHGRSRKTRKSRPTRAFRNSTAIPAGQAPDGYLSAC